MIPFDPLTAGTLLVLAASGKSFCQMPHPAKINVIPKTQRVKYDYSQSFDQLQKHEVDTINPYGYDNITHTNGFMSGNIQIKSEVKLDHKAYPQYGAYCVWYDEINITIEIDPTIVIAREVAADPCMGKAVKTHELKHVKVDRLIVNKYAKTMGKKLYDGLKQRGFMAGPIRAEYVSQTAERMRETVGQLLELEYKKMEIERAESQQRVDSLGEYQSVQDKCEAFNTLGDKATGASRQ
ncbi:MAG: hypothetical protein KDI46_01605 [Alphaproteobacteria bacterium]|nr:hypothetical protein [Alphaproteobacteria bacterium]